MNTKSKFTASNTGIARIGTYDSFVEENDGKPVDIGYALNLITSDDLAFKAVAVVDKLPNPKDAAPGLFYQLNKDFYTLNSAEDGFDKVILGADTTLGLTNNLQQQIDTLEAASDVADVVGTKAELDSYPTENLTDRAIVEVMRDETQDDATAYYRYDSESESFSLVGVLGVYYTKAEADAKFATEDYVTTEFGKINSIAPLTVDTAPTSDDPTGVSIGDGATVTGNYHGIAIGSSATVDGDSYQGVAIGYQSHSHGSGSVVIGQFAADDASSQYSGAGSVIVGGNSEGQETYVTVVGGRASASGYNSVAIGNSSVATSSKEFSIGSDDLQRRITHVTDPVNAQDAATKNYVDIQLTPINAKLQYVPENTNQVLSQIETNVEKAQSAADAKVASITAGTGIAVDDSTPTAPVISTTGLATQASVDALTNTVNSKADQTDLDSLEATVANKADASALADYATKTELTSKADQTAVDTLETTVAGKADTSALGNYATKAELNAKADASALTGYATKEELADKANQTDLDSLETTVNGKADTSALANYATKTELAAKADTSALDSYATKAELSAKADQTAVDAKVSSVTAGTGVSITGSATAPVVNGMIAVPDYENAQAIDFVMTPPPFNVPSNGVMYDVCGDNVSQVDNGTLTLSIVPSGKSDSITIADCDYRGGSSPTNYVFGVYPVSAGDKVSVVDDHGSNTLATFAPYKFVEIN